MPTTTVTTKFDPVISDWGLDLLKQRATAFSSEPKIPLQNFFTSQGIPVDTDNLVSETIDWTNWTRTVVRSWDTNELAQAWLQSASSVVTESTYPGHIISTQIDP